MQCPFLHHRHHHHPSNPDPNLNLVKHHHHGHNGRHQQLSRLLHLPPDPNLLLVQRLRPHLLDRILHQRRYAIPLPLTPTAPQTQNTKTQILYHKSTTTKRLTWSFVFLQSNSRSDRLVRLPDRVHRDADGDGVPDQDAVPAVLHGVGHLHLDRVVRERDRDCEREADCDLMGCFLVIRGGGSGWVRVRTGEKELVLTTSG